MYQSDSITRLILIFVMMSFLVTLTESIICYECDTTKTPECDDDFNRTVAALVVRTCVGKACFKSKSTYSGESYIARKCLQKTLDTECITITEAGVTGTGCSCTSDLCNRAPISQMNYINLFFCIFIFLCF